MNTGKRLTCLGLLGLAGPLLLANVARSGPPAPASPAAQARDADAAGMAAYRSYLVTIRKGTAASVADSDRASRAAEARLSDSLDQWSRSVSRKTCSAPADQRAAAEANAALTGATFRRAAGVLHTEVPDLVASPACTGDIAADRLVPRYLEAAGRGELGAATHLLELFDQQLSCLSVRQLEVVSFALRVALETSAASASKRLGACGAPSTSVMEQAAVNLMWRVLEHRLPYSRIELGWLKARRETFLGAVRDSGSLLARMRLWVGQRSAPEQMAQLSAACRTGAGGRPAQFVGADGAITCDPLAAVIRSMNGAELGLGDCRGGDLEGLSSGRPSQTVGCRASCSSLSALGWPGHAGTIGAPPGMSGPLQGLLALGETPLGSTPSEVQGQCGRFGGGGGIGGGAGGASGAALGACMMSGPATSTTPSSLLTCMRRGLTNTSAAAAASMPLRACGTTAGDGGKQPPAPSGSGSATPSTPSAAPSTPAPSGSGGGTPAASAAPTPRVSLDPASVTARAVARAESARVRESWTRGSEADPTAMQRLADSLDDFPVIPDGDLSLDGGIRVERFEVRVRGSFSCAPDSSCSGSCTGNDRFSQVFQTCSEQAERRTSFHPPVYPTGGDPMDRGGAFGSCVTPGSVPLPSTCPALDCPEGQRATPTAGGTCRCTSGGGGSSSSGGRPPCSVRVRCGEGQTPSADGCSCSGGGGSVPGLGPIPGGSSGGLPGVPGLGSVRGPTLPGIPSGLPSGGARR